MSRSGATGRHQDMFFLRLELVVLLHCFNLFIHIQSIERDVSVLSHLYIILINERAKMSLYTHTNVHRKQVAMNITDYSRLDLFSFFFLFFFFCFQENGKKMIV